MECPVCTNFLHDSHAPSQVRLLWGWITDEIGDIITVCQAIKSCSRHDLQIIDISEFAHPRGSRNLHRIFKLIPQLSNFTLTRLPKRNKKQCATNHKLSKFVLEGIESELQTKFRGNPLTIFRMIRKVEYQLLKSVAARLQLKLQGFYDSETQVWIIENGRYSYQRVLIEAARAAKAKCLFIEGGTLVTSNDRFYFRPYTPHSRVARNEAFSHWRERGEASSAIDVSTKWFRDRTVSSNSNVFNRRFSETFPKVGNQKLAVFFTSSADEYESFWREWTLLGWESQYESFYEIAAYLKKNGFRLALRLHPILLNKSTPNVRSEFFEAIRLATDFCVELILPGSKVSSYDLISKANLVVVSQSTVGLEALQLGKKVVATANCFFEECEDVLLFEKNANFEELLTHMSSDAKDSNFSKDFVNFDFSSDFQRQSVFIGPSTLSEKLASIFYFRNFVYFSSLFLSEVLDKLFVPIVIWKRLRFLRQRRLRVH